MQDSIMSAALTALAGGARIYVFVVFAPLFGSQSMPFLALPVAVALYLPLHPVLSATLSVPDLSVTSDALMFLGLILKECVTGFVMAFAVMGCVHAALGAGVIIDHQRGASMAQSSDPFSLAESTPTGTLFMLCLVTLFFVSGASMSLVRILYMSYALFPVDAMFPRFFGEDGALFAGRTLNELFKNAVLLCAPFLVLTMLCDAALSLVCRFAPQLNVFMLSMPVKSAVSSLLLIAYLSPFTSHASDLITSMLRTLSDAGFFDGGAATGAQGVHGAQAFHGAHVAIGAHGAGG